MTSYSSLFVILSCGVTSSQSALVNAFTIPTTTKPSFPSTSYYYGTNSRNIKENVNTVVSRNRLNLVDDPNNLIDPVFNTIQQMSDITSGGTSMNTITEIVSTSLFGFGQSEIPIGVSVQPTVGETMTALKAASSAAVISPDQLIASGIAEQKLTLLGDSSAVAPPKIDSEQLNFMARDIDFFSRLPLAALVYVVFDFFFFNAQRVRDQEMYMYDEEYYLDEVDGDELEEMTARRVKTFVASFVIRIVAAFVITYATVLTSKMSFHPNF